MYLPTKEECLNLLNQHEVPDHVQAHSCCVALIASTIAQELSKKGFPINKDLVLAASLLHDIAKIKCLNSKEDHCEQGAKIVSKLGYPEIGDIIRQHVKLDKICMTTNLPAMITNYADKRVKHTQIVTLQERFDDIKNRYVKNANDLKRIENLFQQTKAVEKRIFDAMGADPNFILTLNCKNEHH